MKYKDISVYSQPPEKISKQIKILIRDVKKVFGPNKSSKSPLPHLTIRSSLKVPVKDMPIFYKTLKAEFKKLKKPVIQINSWKTIPKNSEFYGLVLKVEKNRGLSKIHKSLEKLFRNYKKTYTIKKFSPHISLAWNMKKEMKKENFDKTIEYLKTKKFNYKTKYKFDKLYLYESIGEEKYKLIKIIK